MKKPLRVSNWIGWCFGITYLHIASSRLKLVSRGSLNDAIQCVSLKVLVKCEYTCVSI